MMSELAASSVHRGRGLEESQDLLHLNHKHMAHGRTLSCPILDAVFHQEHAQLLRIEASKGGDVDHGNLEA